MNICNISSLPEFIHRGIQANPFNRSATAFGQGAYDSIPAGCDMISKRCFITRGPYRYSIPESDTDLL